MKLQDIDFLIIGATKSATTWLQRSLQADPSVFMPDPELHYFSREFSRGEAWYLDQFRGAAAPNRIGEKSNSYLEERTAAERIAQLLPWARLVAQLRSPVERAYSDYCMMYRRGEVGRDVARYLDPRRPQDTRLLSAGFYGRQLAVYYDLFPAEQLLVTFYETIRTQPEEQLATVRAFLGLPVDATAQFVQRKVKDKTTPMLSPALRRLLGPVKPMVAPFRKSPLFRRMHSALAAEIVYSPLPDDLRERLIDYYAPDVEALGRLIGRDLSDWLRGGTGSLAGSQRNASVEPRQSDFVKTESTAGFT
ncbi:sulfotransferase [Kaistia sp. 32K]|uniref:sulfotransferase family protein n=1 Tax=Kaistia sp. 32K TaxID=2795690 RepID=UPI001915C512|nr:sulfotransferase [Kaistia sp. 32K]BCP53907.1 sulfotransferase [Kaistia sp. 32K]